MYILAGSHVLAMFILQQEVNIQCVHYANYKLTLLPFRRLPLSLGVPEGAAAHVLPIIHRLSLQHEGVCTQGAGGQRGKGLQRL